MLIREREVSCQNALMIHVRRTRKALEPRYCLLSRLSCAKLKVTGLHPIGSKTVLAGIAGVCTDGFGRVSAMTM